MPLIETDSNVTEYRTEFERISDALNTIQARIDELDEHKSIMSHDAVSMVGDLNDIIATAHTLRDSIACRSIRHSRSTEPERRIIAIDSKM